MVLVKQRNDSSSDSGSHTEVDPPSSASTAIDTPTSALSAQPDRAKKRWTEDKARIEKEISSESEDDQSGPSTRPSGKSPPPTNLELGDGPSRPEAESPGWSGLEKSKAKDAKSTRPAKPVDREERELGKISKDGASHDTSQPSRRRGPQALRRGWEWFWGWDGWVLVRAYLAVPVSLAIAGLMIAIAGTGPVIGDWWWFCTAGDVRLGGLGYNQGGGDVVGFFYSIKVQGTAESSSDSINPFSEGEPDSSGAPSLPTSFALAIPTSFNDSLILCVLLYLFALIGIISATMILYIGLLTSCRSSTEARSLNPCATNPTWKVDVEDRAGTMTESRLDRMARADNRIPENEWEQMTRSQKNLLRMQARFRTVYVQTVDYTALAGLPLAVALFVWVDQVDAEGDWGYSALIAWIVLVFPGWFLARKLFRSAPKIARDQKRALMRRGKDGIMNGRSGRQGRDEEYEMKVRGRSTGRPSQTPTRQSAVRGRRGRPPQTRR